MYAHRFAIPAPRPRILGVAAIFAVLLALGGVAGASPALAHPATTPAPAYVRLVHAAPVAPTVDILVDGTAIATNVAFRAVVDYAPWSAGTHEVTIQRSGDATQAPVIKQQITVASGTMYTLAIVGDKNTGAALIGFTDDNTLISGKVKVRVYHFSSDIGPVALAVNGATVVPTVRFLAATNYFTLTPGVEQFLLTAQENGRTISKSTTLPADHVISIFGVGLSNDTGANSFGFVAASSAGMPSGMPPTGFAPASATSHSAALQISSLASLLPMLVLLGGLALAYRRRQRA